MTLTWYATNNMVTLGDQADLEALGIVVTARSRKPVHAYRDPDTGRMIAEVGAVAVYRDGRVRITPRSDCPDAGVEVLLRTALDCVERDLHRADSWHYYRATRTDPVGQWAAVIAAGVPDGTSVFAAHAVALSPAHRPGARTAIDPIHTRA